MATNNVDNSSTLATSLFSTLTEGVSIPPSPDLTSDNFNITPDTTSALYADVASLAISDVTEDCIEGEGAFDKFMSSMDKHLQREFKSNRITGTQYAEIYAGVSQGVMSQAVAFTLQKDQARWQAISAQMQARIVEIQATQALVELEATKINLVRSQYEMNLVAAQYAKTKMELATEEARHDLTVAQTCLAEEQFETARASTKDTLSNGSPVEGSIGRQMSLLSNQVTLTQEQVEAERAKTLDTRSDGATVTGSVGKQKDLYTQQIDSFVKDAKYKTAKMYLDSWITQKTLDDGLLAPTQFTNAEVENVMQSIRTENNL